MTLQPEDRRAVVEWLKCRFSFLYFCRNYIHISDPERGVIPFESWPHLERLTDDFMDYREIVILKARQLGISWLCAAYALWTAIFFESARVLLLSQGEAEAKDLLSKCIFIHRYLPSFLKLRIGSANQGLLKFDDLHSEVRALPSTERAGHGYSAKLVIRDELEHHPNAEENFAAISPSIDSGGQMIDLSTVDKTKLITHFKERYKKARSGENGAHPVFLSWRERPVRRQGESIDDWFANTVKKKYKAWQIEQEYPENETEALASTTAGKFFDTKALDDMQKDCYPPVELRYGGVVKIWKPPVIGTRYIIANDPSDGKADPHAIVVLDWATLEVVATSHGMLPAEQVAQIHDELVRDYRDAFNTYERNAVAGGVVEQKLRELATPNQYHPKVGKEDTGFWTGGNMKNSVRSAMIWRLETIVRNRQLRVHDLDIITDMNDFIQPQDDVPQAAVGAHDDFVMVLAIVMELRKMMPNPSSMTFKTVALRRA